MLDLVVQVASDVKQTASVRATEINVTSIELTAKHLDLGYADHSNLTSQTVLDGISEYLDDGRAITVDDLDRITEVNHFGRNTTRC